MNYKLLLGLLFLNYVSLFSKRRIDLKFILDGHQRECIIVIPGKLPPPNGYPVVFMLHGTSGDGEKFYNISGWKELGEEENFITVFPSSLTWCFVEDNIEKHNTRWVNGNVTEFPCSGPPQNYVDDVKFLKLLATQIADSLPVNRKMIFASGFSNGCSMIHKLAVDAGDVFAAVTGGSSILTMSDSARPINRIPIWTIVGTLDDRFIFSPYTELPFGGDSILTYLQIPIGRVLGSQGLTDNFIKSETPITHTYQFLDNKPGELAKPYIFTLVKDMIHEYPNGLNYPLNGPKIFWEFFKRSITVGNELIEDKKYKVSVYPNPSNELITIDFSTWDTNWPISIKVFNAYGQSVYTRKLMENSKISIYKKELGEGLFFIHIKNNSYSYSQKVIFN